VTAPTSPSRVADPSGLDAAAVTHSGAVRTLNEDSYLVTPWLCLVADGMGGHDSGEVASQTIVELFANALDQGRLELGDLEPLIAEINTSVHEAGRAAGAEAMGSTLVGVALVDNGGEPSAVVFHVGDSRCYRLRDDDFEQLTTDHSHVQELVAAGKLRADDAASHPLRNVVTRAIGPESSVVADFIVLPDQACRLLLCSDGVSGELGEEIVHRTLASGKPPDATALALIEEVLKGPARDNATAVVVDLDLSIGSDITVPRIRIEEMSTEITAPRGGTTTS
jgi:protein phosphatase